MSGLEIPLLIGGIAASTSIAALQARQQEKAAEGSADIERERTKIQRDRVRRDSARRIGSTRAAFGAAGVEFTGTTLDVLADQAFEAELDAQAVTFGGAIRTRDHLIQADAARSRGTASLLGGPIKAGVGIATISARKKASRVVPGSAPPINE
jgi:hypothetical protein